MLILQYVFDGQDSELEDASSETMVRIRTFKDASSETWFSDRNKRTHYKKQLVGCLMWKMLILQCVWLFSIQNGGFSCGAHAGAEMEDGTPQVHHGDNDAGAAHQVQEANKRMAHGPNSS